MTGTLTAVREPEPAPPGPQERRAGTAYLAMLGFPVGAHRWYLGHTLAGVLYVVTFALLAIARFALRERVEQDFAPIWTVAVGLVVAQLVLDAIAIPRWARKPSRDVPLPAPLILLLGVLATIFLLPFLLDVLGSAFSGIFGGNTRVGRQVAMMIIAIIGVPLVLVGYIVLMEHTLRHFTDVAQRRIRPWLWLLPALFFLYTFLVYPTYGTIRRSLYNRAGDTFIGLENYRWFFESPNTLTALRNNVLWLVFFTVISVIGGLLVATLFDRVRYENFAKTIVFVPMAISFVAASVVWRFMYVWNPNLPGSKQTGTLNAIIVALGGEPIDFISTRGINNFALIAVACWIWVGFCMVILSAGIKSIDRELLEAARVDGATEWQVFRRIMLPLLAPTIAVVTTTMLIFALKTFDIVYAMTNGNFDTNVIALEMWNQFSYAEYGRASAVAVVLLAAIVPVMAYNIRSFRRQEEVR
ncbi:MAG: sugar ABC transporter permease [Actinomycetes bacterium]|jgi:alpha-glucoside transport system permease protein